MSSFEFTVPGELGDPAVRAAEVAEPGAVTIVVPTFNESANIGELLRRITESVPTRLPCEVVFVDDSTDDTPEVIDRGRAGLPVPRHRHPPRGGRSAGSAARSSRACKAATSDWIVVMDGDCQHPPSLVPELVATGERANAELVVATRYIKGGSRAGLAGSYRVAVSRGVDLADQVPVPAQAARHQRPDERVLRDPPQRGHRRHPPAARLQDPARAGRPQPPPPGRRGALRLPGPRSPASPSRPRRRACASCATSSACAPRRPAARMVGFGLIGATGFLPNLLGLSRSPRPACTTYRAEILANQLGVAWNFLLIEHLLFRDRRRHRRWWDRAGRFALLANADLVLRMPLIALFVDRFGMGVLSATALALVTTFVLRFAGTEALVYLPRQAVRQGGPARRNRDNSEESRVDRSSWCAHRDAVRPGSSRRRRTALVGVGALTAGLLLVSPQPASAANLVQNPGFETAGSGGMPYCWEKSGWGDNDFTFATVADAHAGTKAMKVDADPPGRRRPQGADHRVSGVRARRSRRASSTTSGSGTRRRRPDACHHRCSGTTPTPAGSTGPTSRPWTCRAAGPRPTVRTPAVPAGTDHITWGVSVYGTGSVTTDDYTMEQVADPVPPRHLHRHRRASAPRARGRSCPRRTRSAPCTPSSSTTARCC